MAENEQQEINAVRNNARNSDFRMKNKIYELIRYASPCLDQFPRIEKYGLASDIRRTLYTILRYVVMLENKHYKKTTLGDLDTELDVLRHFVRLAADKDLHKDKAPCLSMKQYENISRYIAEIGGMIGKYYEYLNGGNKGKD